MESLPRRGFTLIELLVTLAVLAVLVLYVLTMPVVVWSYYRTNPRALVLPPGLAAYATPYRWLETTPLGQVLGAYSKWAKSVLRDL